MALRIIVVFLALVGLSCNEIKKDNSIPKAKKAPPSVIEEKFYKQTYTKLSNSALVNLTIYDVTEITGRLDDFDRITLKKHKEISKERFDPLLEIVDTNKIIIALEKVKPSFSHVFSFKYENEDVDFLLSRDFRYAFIYKNKKISERLLKISPEISEAFKKEKGNS